MRGWWSSTEACSVLGICATERPCDDPVVTGTAIPYLLAGGFAVGLILCADWLQRRTGQSWWALDQLGWAAISTLLAALLVYSGHLWGALGRGRAGVVRDCLGTTELGEARASRPTRTEPARA